MEERKLGRTGHNCSILTLGGFAFSECSQHEADRGIAMALEAGIKQVDVSPIYGRAESRLGSWFKRHGNPFFLSCKTAERTKRGAAEGLRRSLETLQVERFDIYQFHMVDNQGELDTILGPDGALEAVLEAQRAGLVRFIGITGHHPPLHLQAIQRFNFDSVMFPLNRVHAAGFAGWNDWRELLKTAQTRGTAVYAIKVAAKRLWEDESRPRYNTWYEPFDDPEEIRKSLWYTLSQPISTAVTPGELKLLPYLIKAANEFKPLSRTEQARYVKEVAQYPPLHAAFMD
jgi:aryl-alcohol dehydrogenase-like predicted oxidoreductase